MAYLQFLLSDDTLRVKQWPANVRSSNAFIVGGIEIIKISKYSQQAFSVDEKTDVVKIQKNEMET